MKIPFHLSVEEIRTWIIICEFAIAYCRQRRLENIMNSNGETWKENLIIIETWRKRLEGMTGK